MRFRLAHLALFAWLATGWQPAYAQSQTSDDGSNRTSTCLTAASQELSPSGRVISIRDVTFSGFIQMPVADQDEIVAKLKQQKYTAPLDGVVDEALARIRAGWQDRGYFKVDVTGNAKTVAQSPNGFEIALFVNVDENVQYRLGGIRFKDNRAINSASLRNIFLTRDGEIFSRKTIAEGLENLRKAYGEFGYVNYTGVPETTFDEEKKLAYLEIDVDEGKQFYVTGIELEGLDESSRQKLSKELALHRGDIYNTRLLELSTSRMASLFPTCQCRPKQSLRLDEPKGTLMVTLDFRSCSAN